VKGVSNRKKKRQRGGTVGESIRRGMQFKTKGRAPGAKRERHVLLTVGERSGKGILGSNGKKMREESGGKKVVSMRKRTRENVEHKSISPLRTVARSASVLREIQCNVVREDLRREKIITAKVTWVGRSIGGEVVQERL